MYRFYFDKKPTVENCQRNTVSVFVRHNFLEIAPKFREKGINLDLNKEEGVKRFIEVVGAGVTINLKQEVKGEVFFTEKLNPVKLTYTRSNLGKGFVFWFICNSCGRRVRDLYFPPNTDVLACRKCHRLSYRSQNENNSKSARTYRKLFGFE